MQRCSLYSKRQNLKVALNLVLPSNSWRIAFRSMSFSSFSSSAPISMPRALSTVMVDPPKTKTVMSTTHVVASMT